MVGGSTLSSAEGEGKRGGRGGGCKLWALNNLCGDPIEKGSKALRFAGCNCTPGCTEVENTKDEKNNVYDMHYFFSLTYTLC